MPKQCELKTKLKTIEELLTELDCIPKTRWNGYWLSNMPELNDDDIDMMPKEVLELYHEWRKKCGIKTPEEIAEENSGCIVGSLVLISIIIAVVIICV